MPAVTVVGLKLTVVPPGLPVATKLIGLVNVPIWLVVKVIAIVAGAGQATETGAGVPKLNPLVTAVILKFALLISKKILPTASTLTLAVVDAGTAGIVNA